LAGRSSRSGHGDQTIPVYRAATIPPSRARSAAFTSSMTPVRIPPKKWRYWLSRTHEGRGAMMHAEKRVPLSDDPFNAIVDGPQMQFRLTYEGNLLASQPGDASHGNGDKKHDHKHELRQIFHRQLKRLREITPILEYGRKQRPRLGRLCQNYWIVTAWWWQGQYRCRSAIR
jgi:hypothetical protein